MLMVGEDGNAPSLSGYQPGLLLLKYSPVSRHFGAIHRKFGVICRMTTAFCGCLFLVPSVLGTFPFQ